MFHFVTSTLTHLLTTYGYWAVLLFVAVESTGIPFPGETMLLVAAIYTGMTPLLFISLVIVAGISILAGESEEKLGRRRAVRTCPSLDLVRKTIQPRRTCLAKPQHTTEEVAPSEAIRVPLDLDEVRIVSQEWLASGTIRVEVIAKTTQATCPQCHTCCVKIHDTRPRKKRDIALRGHPIELILLKRRFRCWHCRMSFTEPDTVCGWRRRTTCRLREAIGKQAWTQPVAQVAAAVGVGPRFVQECFHSVALPALERQGVSGDDQRPLPTPEYLGIDEFARRKGHHYDTILCDVEARRVLEVSMGRKHEEVVALLERLSDPDAVKAVSMDMSAYYRPAVQLCLPKAQIVVDHFHVIQHVMKGFKKVLQSWVHRTEGKPLLAGKQSLFLRVREDLSEEQAQERTRIGAQLPCLEMAWLLKEELRTWSATATNATAAEQLDARIAKVRLHGPDPLRKTLSAFKNWRDEILAFFHFLPRRLSNGFVEGKNNRTKALMRQAYGYRNRHHLRLRILLTEIS